METLNFKIGEGFGLHARPAGVLVQTANKFKSNITVFKDGGNCASAKGLFALLGLKVEAGDNIRFEIEGADEGDARKAIQTLFDNGLKMPDVK